MISKIPFSPLISYSWAETISAWLCLHRWRWMLLLPSLKFAKKTGADARAKAKKADTTIDDTRINFMIVTGSSSSDFTSVYNTAYHRQDDNMHQEFHATLRPYTPDYLRILLGAIRDKDGANLG